jgi:hypothetical protein
MDNINIVDQSFVESSGSSSVNNDDFSMITDDNSYSQSGSLFTGNNLPSVSSEGSSFENNYGSSSGNNYGSSSQNTYASSSKNNYGSSSKNNYGSSSGNNNTQGGPDLSIIEQLNVDDCIKFDERVSNSPDLLTRTAKITDIQRDLLNSKIYYHRFSKENKTKLLGINENMYITPNEKDTKGKGIWSTIQKIDCPDLKNPSIESGVNASSNSAQGSSGAETPSSTSTMLSNSIQGSDAETPMTNSIQGSDAETPTSNSTEGSNDAETPMTNSIQGSDAETPMTNSTEESDAETPMTNSTEESSDANTPNVFRFGRGGSRKKSKKRKNKKTKRNYFIYN